MTARISNSKQPAKSIDKLKGVKTRQSILRTAVDIASSEGLEGLTIGRLATALGMSKSGLFAHFGSKEELQLATLDEARAVFIDEVVRPAYDSERGLSRLWKLCDCWIDYVDREVFSGGCFFAAASAEFDGRPGPVRDRVAIAMREWLDEVERKVAEAVDAGHLAPTVLPKQLAFEINALCLGANWAFQLYGDRDAFARCRAAIVDRLRNASTNLAPALKVVNKTASTKPRRVKK
jgi:AcrR family transcriptional regulator